MYRVETNEFEHGLNFFQKTILKFKIKPGIKDEVIAEYIGLDPKLISIVISELQSKKLINEHGSLSEQGKEKLNEIDGLIVNKGKKKMGYVFKYLNEDKLYQYYVEKVVPADVLEEKKNILPKVVTGTKGDGQDYTEMPFFLNEAVHNKSNFNQPSEREVLQLIQNSSKKGLSEEIDESKREKLSRQLSIRFLDTHPEIVWACTYVYLQQNEDNTYEPDWRVLDPFGFGDNIALKFYLDNPDNENLLDNIQKRFADAKILGGKILSDYQNHLDQLVEKRLSPDFLFGVNTLDENLQLYLKTIIKNYILLQHHDYNNLDASVTFSLNLQNALENIFKQDKEQRNTHYQSVYRDLDNDRDLKKQNLKDIYWQQFSSNNTQVPRALISVSKGCLEKGKSLRSYLVSFILTYRYDNKSPLFKALKDRVELVDKIAQLRNEKGHGQTSREKSLQSFSKEELEKYYDFIKSFINDYINNL
jgi:hypothetical protein